MFHNFTPMMFMEKTPQLRAVLARLQSIFPQMAVRESTFYLMIIYLSFFVEKPDTATTGSTRRKCKSSYWMFLTVIPKDQLLQEAHTLEKQMTTINIIFQSMTYAALGISLLIFTFYLKKMSDMMDVPIMRLT